MPAFAPLVAHSNVPVVGLSLDFEPVQLTGPLALYAGVMRNANGDVVFAARAADPGDTGDGTSPSTPPPLTVSATPASLQPALSISLARPSKTSRVSKARIKMTFPKPVVAAGVATNAKDRETTLDFTIMSSERAMPVEREQAMAFFASLLTNPDVIAVIVDNKSVY